MNLVDELLKVDKEKIDELKTQKYPSHKLADLLGKKGTVDIVLTEVPPRPLNDAISYQMDRNGRVDFSKSYDAGLLLCLDGIKEPNLRDTKLQEHFGCKSAKELCEKIFRSEIDDIGKAILSLSGMNNNEENEETIKN